MIFDDLIKSRHGTSLPQKPDAKESDSDSVSDLEQVHEEPLNEYEDPDESPRLIPEIRNPVDAVGNALNQQPMYDKMIHAELILPQGNELKMAKVIRRTLLALMAKRQEPSIFFPFFPTIWGSLI